MRRGVLAACLLLAGCDWVEYAFVNSIPIEGETADFHVYLAVDGLAFASIGDRFPSFDKAKLITMFPGTSDASWSRILRSERLPGYELEYYDPGRDELIHGGFFGGARHVLPSVSESLSFESKYLSAFDYHANGYGHSLEAYSSPWVSVQESLDNLFFMMEGRIETSRVFTAYLLESDLLGHLASEEECAHYVELLEARIAKFRSNHPGKKIRFTLLSDHGMDFTKIPRERFIDLREELPKVGVSAVQHLAGAEGIAAIPVVHTRVTYVALHTRSELADDVAARTSRLESVDFAAAKLEPNVYGLWSNGELTTRFEYLPEASAYVLPELGTISDEDLFDQTVTGEYPDLYYRVRTALEPIGVQYPAEVLVSLRPGWNSIGFELPGAVDIFGPGYHGAATAVASTGVLITDERELPDYVRADSFLDLFPRAREHLEARGLELVAADRDAARPLR